MKTKRYKSDYKLQKSRLVILYYVFNISMKIIELLKEYIERRIHPDKRSVFTSANRLDLLFADTNDRSVLINKIRAQLMERVMLRVEELLCAEGIEPIHFKGLTLAYLLYDHPEQRAFGDIDFLVVPGDHSKALDILTANGFSVQEEFDGHHVTLNHKGISVEMHISYFHPYDEIEFTVPTEHLQQNVIKGRSLTTLSPTYQLIYMFLHYFTHAKKGHKYTDKMLLLQRYQSNPIIDLSRLYDIALLIERYGKEIDWETCISTLTPFRESPEFQCVLSEFLDVFPSVLPDNFLKAMYSDLLIIAEKFPIFYRLISDSDRCYDHILADIVAHDAPTYSCLDAEPTAYRFIVDEYNKQTAHSYVISRIAPKSSSDLSFKFDLWLEDGKLWLAIDVMDDVLNYLSEGAFPEDYESIGYCDGFTLCIVPVERRYVFHKIYAFLTRNNEGEEYLSVYDIVNSPVALNSIVESNLIVNSNGYTAKIGIPLQYLNLTAENPSFYFNIIVSDSDDEKGCDTALAFDPTPTAWNECRTYPIASMIL